MLCSDTQLKRSLFVSPSQNLKGVQLDNDHRLAVVIGHWQKRRWCDRSFLTVNRTMSEDWGLQTSMITSHTCFFWYNHLATSVQYKPTDSQSYLLYSSHYKLPNTEFPFPSLYVYGAYVHFDLRVAQWPPSSLKDTVWCLCRKAWRGYIQFQDKLHLLKTCLELKNIKTEPSST